MWKKLQNAIIKSKCANFTNFKTEGQVKVKIIVKLILQIERLIETNWIMLKAMAP